ncbi:MAG TPA: hypothetical protein VF599_01740 [Pyrinomonadaceae bacterium]|jgi:hypothetical protein
MKTKQLIYTTFLIILCISNLAAQDWYNNNPTGCEENEARLDYILMQIKKQKDPANVLIIIARSGEGEKSLETSRRRLHNAKEYLLIRRESPIIPRNKIITAIGDRTGSGLGRVELYFGGKLVDQLLVKKNGNLCVDCCQNHQIKPYRKTSNRKITSKRKKT